MVARTRALEPVRSDARIAAQSAHGRPHRSRFETERLRLRRLEASTTPRSSCAWSTSPPGCGSSATAACTIWTARGSYIAEGPQRLYANHGFGLFLVERRSDALPLGLCGLIKRDTLPDVDIGFAFLPEHWGQGYAREAAEATLRYARERHRLPRVVAITSLDNVASGRLLERIGLQFEGTVRLAGSERGGAPVRHDGVPTSSMRRTPVPYSTASGRRASCRSADIQRLPEFGIEAVVNLALPTASNALPGEAEAVTGQGMPFVQIPVPWEKPEPRHLQQFFGVMDAFAGRRVWVHCAKNFRVSAFVYLYRRLRLGEAHEAALYPHAHGVAAESDLAGVHRAGAVGRRFRARSPAPPGRSRRRSRR